MKEHDEGPRELDRKIAAAKRALERMDEPPVEVNFVNQLPPGRPKRAGSPESTLRLHCRHPDHTDV